MDLQNNSGALNDAAGVLPMDTGAPVNGNHDEDDHPSSSVNGGVKKGRGRPPKSPGSTKPSVKSDTPKRARGRPPKTGENPSPVKKPVAVTAPVDVAPKKKQEEVPAATNGDASKKKRGRPSKSSTSDEQNNVISKPQVVTIPAVNHQEQEDSDEPAKKKRGRPSGTSPKKPVVAASPSKEAVSTKRRGRPSGSASGKKSAAKPKASVSVNGSARKRGRPKKSSGETAVVSTPANDTAAVTSNNVQ